MVISGAIGPRGDGYVADDRMTELEAENYHAEQISVFAGMQADQVTAGGSGDSFHIELRGGSNSHRPRS
jgi:hypothetical protein